MGFYSLLAVRQIRKQVLHKKRLYSAGIAMEGRATEAPSSRKVTIS